MKFLEAIKAMEEGKKVRSIEWPREEYVFLSKSGHIKNEENIDSNLYSDSPSQEWEIYQEPEKTYTFHQALKLLKNGSIMNRKSSSGPTFGVCMRDGLLYYVHRFCFPLTFNLEDYEATDWIEVKQTNV